MAEHGMDVMVEVADGAALGEWLRNLAEDVTGGKVVGFNLQTALFAETVGIKGTLYLPMPKGLKVNVGKSRAERLRENLRAKKDE